MYLRKKIYIGANYDHNKVEGTIDLVSRGKKVNIDLKKVTYVIEEAAYWRKANAIHGWFVDNVQDGVDECQESYVSYEQLQELKKLCLEVIETKDASKLQPRSGFFFGSTEVDEYYMEDLKRTVEMLDKLDPDADYYYQASW
jgi:wyosine [tRNA(Phe)-imidazoG37] synthetase (radical SAM superfamily)